MSEIRVELQEHGYRNGHQLLTTSINLPREDQDTVDRLSDMAGQLSPGETFDPYITAYPLPSRTHYVVARTWQDFDTPRAGCVLTKSVLIPMLSWETLDRLEGLLTYLTHFKPRGNCKSVAIEFGQNFRPQPIVNDNRVVELVESVFFEKRQPIVFFDAPEAEAITLRILSVLWPKLRRNFAACTNSLAPRKIEERYFDLVFSPISARIRFADHPHHKIHLTVSNSSRRRWSEPISNQIFKSKIPSLGVSDKLGLLARDKQGDASKLRLVLFWEELETKVESTPTAILGMLDLISSQTESPSTILEQLTPKIVKAIGMASDTLPEPDAWQFLITLLGKFRKWYPTPKQVLNEIKYSAANLVERDPEVAIELILKFSKNNQMPPFVILAEMGDGFSSSDVFQTLPGKLTDLQPDIGLSLLLLSDRFTSKVFEMAKIESKRWTPWLHRLFRESSLENMSKVRKSLVPMIDDGVLAPLLVDILQGVSSKELVAFVIQMGNITSFSIKEFDEPLMNATNDLATLEYLRDAVAKNFDCRGADRFLLGMLRFDLSNIAWLCSGAIRKQRALTLLIRLLENQSDRQIREILSEHNTRDMTLELLLHNPTKSASQIARILVLSEFTIEKFLELGLQILPILNAGHTDMFKEYLLKRTLEEASPNDNRIDLIISSIGLDIDPSRLIRMATVQTASSLRIGANIVVLEATSKKLRKRIVNRIDEFSEGLTTWMVDCLDKDAYAAWAEMIKDCGNSNNVVQTRAAKSTLSYVLRLINCPVSALLIVTFPIVYHQLSLEKTKDKGNAIMFPWEFFPPFVYFGSGQFSDPHKKLLRELVEAFLKSSWPPADLILVAIDSGIEETVVTLLRRTYKGNQYIKSIKEDSQRLGKNKRKRIQKILSK